MKKKNVQVKAHFLALTSVAMLFFDSLFGFLIYDSIQHRSTPASFSSSNPNDIMETWSPCGFAALTLLWLALSVYFFLHEKEKPAIWVMEDKLTNLSRHIFLFVFLFNVPIFSLWHNYPVLSVILHLVLLFIEVLLVSILQKMKKHKARRPSNKFSHFLSHLKAFPIFYANFFSHRFA